eukprot:383967-Pelagomonas_calceolata.AAC.2
MKTGPRTDSKYLLRSRGGYGGNREHSAAATATPPASKVCHPSQLLPGQKHILLPEIKYCEDTRPKNQLNASKQQHHDLYCHLLRASAQDTCAKTAGMVSRFALEMGWEDLAYLTSKFQGRINLGIKSECTGVSTTEK